MWKSDEELSFGPIVDWRTILMELIAFLPRVEGPLVVELVEFLRRHEGIYMSIDWGIWDFVSSGSDEDVPQVAVKSVRNRIPRETMTELTTSPIPIKIILVEGQNPDIDSLVGAGALLASSGIGVYVRNYGWVTLPSRKMGVNTLDKALIRSHRWKKDEEGVWRKRCRRCGVWKTTEEYSKSGRSYGHDPYRDPCKACDNELRAERLRKSRAGA